MEIGKLLDGEDIVVDVPFLDDATIRIRYIPRDELLALYRKAQRTTWDRKHQPVTKVDDEMANRLLGEAAIKGWSGLTEGGAEIPFTPENRDRLMQVWGELFRFVNETCTDLQVLVDTEKEAARKNSSSTSAPGETFPA